MPGYQAPVVCHHRYRVWSDAYLLWRGKICVAHMRKYSGANTLTHQWSFFHRGKTLLRVVQGVSGMVNERKNYRITDKRISFSRITKIRKTWLWLVLTLECLKKAKSCKAKSRLHIAIRILKSLFRGLRVSKSFNGVVKAWISVGNLSSSRVTQNLQVTDHGK